MHPPRPCPRTVGYNYGMEPQQPNQSPQRKLVFAPLGADMFGDDILLFEHGILFALETAVEAAGGFASADVHDALGGTDKKDHPVPPLTEGEVYALAAKAQCDALVDGMLSCERDAETGALARITVSLRVFFPAAGEFAAPDSLTFTAFDTGARPEVLALDYDLWIALQYRLCVALLDALGANAPWNFTTDALQVTPFWPAYVAFLKGKRLARTPETKLGYYEQAVQQDPDFFLALYNSAMLYKTQTDYAMTRKRLSQAAAVTDDPADLGDIYFELGLASIYLGDPKTARNFWEKALEYAPDNPALSVNMAGTYEQEENWNEAIRLNEQALEKAPDYHKAVVSLGRLHAMFGRLDQAIPLYERALELQPDDALRRSVLGGCYLADGRPEDARAQFEQAVALDPKGDPGQYAAQELEKLGPKSREDAGTGEGEDGMGGGPKKKRWGLF
jgi:tetratricopeptide (TPR) repeat protein